MNNVLTFLVLLFFCTHLKSSQANIVKPSIFCTDKTKIPRNILDLNTNEKRQFLNSFDAFFTDIDGVLWTLTNHITGAGKAINLIREAGKKVAFITNNSVRPIDNLKNQFKIAGIDFDTKDLIHPLQSVITYLKKNQFDGLIYCIGTETFKNGLRNAGFRVIDGPNEIIKESFTTLASHVFDKEPVKAVVVDVDFNLSSLKLIRAQMYLVRNPGTILLIGATDMTLPVKPGINIIGPGPFGKILEETSEIKPVVLGKPGAGLCQILMDQYNIKDPKRSIIVGDMLKQDMGLGKICGFQTMAVLSGGCKKEDFIDPNYSDVLPDYYVNSLADFIEFFDKLKQ